MPTIIPALLAKDEQDFKTRIADKELRALAPLWQIDILNGTLFPETSWADPTPIAGFDLPQLELHIMTQTPIAVLKPYLNAQLPIERAVFHSEIDDSIEETVAAIHALSLKAGLAISPKTRFEDIKDSLNLPDYILVMGVEPGASGQPFLGDMILQKIAMIRHANATIPISVDGGITLENAKDIIAAGATELIVGSMFWQAPDKQAVFRSLSTI